MPGQSEQGYLSELVRNWRPLLAATVGLGTGLSTLGFVTSTLAPHMIRDNGWSAADFAMVTSLAIVNVLAIPIIGRLADVIGVRYTALIGMLTLPATYFALSLIGGSLTSYVVIFLVQAVIGMTTTATVFTRLVVQCIERSRGLALAIAASGPALTGAIGAPLLNNYVEAEGWRASFQVLALFSLAAGLITYLLIPRGGASAPVHRPKASPAPRQARKDYKLIMSSPAFWILILSMLLCNLPQVLMLSQFKLLLLDNGVSGNGASLMLSALSVGMLTGRFLTGAALDRFDPYLVSFLTLGLPSVGLFVFASPLDTPAFLTLSAFFLGFAFGAEGDIVAYLVSKNFGVVIYSSVMGLVTAAISASAAGGAALLSMTMGQSGDFVPFLRVAGTGVLVGAALLLLLRRTRPVAVSQALA